jgi:hypothetical protein
LAANFCSSLWVHVVLHVAVFCIFW